MGTPVRLNLGCGPVQPDGWVNIDGSMRAWLTSRLYWLDRLLVSCRILSPTDFGRSTRFADLRRPLRWPDCSVDCVYMGEVLEHFTREDGQALLRECFRVLKPGGVLRIRVPDNAQFWRDYLSAFDAVRSKPRAEWTDEHSRWVEMFFRDICVRRQWRGSFGHYHKWMYDEVSLVCALERLGFTSVQRRGYLESAIPDVAAVEVRELLNVEGAKPPPEAP